jgi:hypothetical protein
MNDQNVQTYAASRVAIEEAQAYATSLGRPRVLFIPTAVLTGQVIEQEILVYGWLNTKPLDGVSLRSHLLPNVLSLGGSPGDLERLGALIDQGWVVIWARPANTPPVQEEYPALRRITDNPDVVMRTFEHNALGIPRIISVGYVAGSVTPSP